MFEIVEIDATSSNLETIRSAIFRVLSEGHVAVFRGAGNLFSLDQWSRFLAQRCGFGHDRRHFNLSSVVELADWWEISYQPEKSISYAYSNTRQPLHNDNAWFSDPAEMNFFIMRKQAPSGGENTLYPLSRLMNDLESEDKALFHDLCYIPVTIKKGDGQFFNHSTIIVPGSDPRIFWNFHRTEKPTATIQKLCGAFSAFLERKENTSSVERLRCASGDGFCFHDQKLLHGRMAFVAHEAFERILHQSMWRLPRIEGSYLV